MVNDFGRKLIAEFIGTFALIFMGAGSIIVFGGGQADIVAIALAHGLAIALLVSALGHISGGLFNPALTIGLWATRRLDSVTTVAYIVAQLVGAVVGAFALKMFPEALGEAAHWGTPLLGSETSFTQGAVIEVILTFFLMLAVFGTALDPRGPSIGGFGIGLVITMDILAAGPLTGAAMNPARTFGPALVNNIWDDHLVYWIGPIIGAVLAALVYHYVFMEREPETAAV
jgi:MIP family channel proteins